MKKLRRFIRNTDECHFYSTLENGNLYNKYYMKFVFSNIDAKDPARNRMRSGSKLVSRSQKQKGGSGEIITDEKKTPLFYKRRIKAPKYEYY